MDLKEAELIAKRLMIKHSLYNWCFKWDNAKLRYGYCKYSTKTISLSRNLTELNTKEHFLNTIKHEIAHAKLGRGHGHDNVFYDMCDVVGCAAERCYSPDVIEPKAKFYLKCPNCGKIKPVFRDTNKDGLNDRACGKCCRLYSNGEYDDRFKLVRVDIDTQTLML
jgi:predicted SprT family Zn-dependent metalloprotease